MATSLLPVGNAIFDFGSPVVRRLALPGVPLFQFITYMFLHADMGHIFFNMFALWMFGRTLEYELGSRRFLIYYLVCGVGAALIQVLTAWLLGETPIQLVGASGAVMGTAAGLRRDASQCGDHASVPAASDEGQVVCADLRHHRALFMGWTGAATWPTLPMLAACCGASCCCGGGNARERSVFENPPR